MNKTFLMTNESIQDFNVGNERVDIIKDFSFLDSNVNNDGNCSVELKRRLILGRKAMINLEKLTRSKRYQSEYKDQNNQNDGLFDNDIWL